MGDFSPQSSLAGVVGKEAPQGRLSLAGKPSNPSDSAAWSLDFCLQWQELLCSPPPNSLCLAYVCVQVSCGSPC